ncbi:MAG: sulfurtransferase [Candidatus Tectomicrobia bacterium]|nr:sulfurtransferase [Candidatus Tectomicrobia bacterium]
MERHGSPHLVETGWLADRLEDPRVRAVEVDWDPADGYDRGHIPGALCWRWKEDLWHPTSREFLEGDAFRGLMSRSGVRSDAAVVLYGDSTRFATYALFFLQLRGHADARILHGGRTRWIAEGRPLTREVPSPRAADYRPGPPDPGIRATREDILASLGDKSRLLLDVRSAEEYRGERVAPPGMADCGAERAGRIPGAAHLPWADLVREDDTFLSPPDLRSRFEAAGATPDRDIIVYCRMSHRASLVWFVLKHLMGYPRARSYDGSWTEWGSMVGMPIER